MPSIPLGNIDSLPKTVPAELEKSISQEQWQEILRMLRIAENRAVTSAKNTIFNISFVLPCALCCCWAGEEESQRIRQYQPVLSYVNNKYFETRVVLAYSDLGKIFVMDPNAPNYRLPPAMVVNPNHIAVQEKEAEKPVEYAPVNEFCGCCGASVSISI